MMARVGEEVGDAAEAGLLAHGQLEGRDAGAEALLERGQGAVEAGPLAVELVDEHQRGRPSSAASSQAASVWASTPSTALTTMTARSTTEQAARTSPKKSA